jgi:hypothetical protein
MTRASLKSVTARQRPFVDAGLYQMIAGSPDVGFWASFCRVQRSKSHILYLVSAGERLRRIRR